MAQVRWLPLLRNGLESGAKSRHSLGRRRLRGRQGTKGRCGGGAEMLPTLPCWGCKEEILKVIRVHLDPYFPSLARPTSLFPHLDQYTSLFLYAYSSSFHHNLVSWMFFCQNLDFPIFFFGPSLSESYLCLRWIYILSCCYSHWKWGRLMARGVPGILVHFLELS